ncbi:MAG: tetratricopeptide repeat protein [Planctomycetota bacterium]|jgi:outer membrane protein assembly factor BamD (BamD/ComL family)
MKLVILALAVLLVALSTASAGISADSEEKLLSEVAEAQELVNTGQTKAARRAYNAVKKGYPEIAGTDFEIFIDAEIYYCRAKITKAVRNYDKLLKEYPQSKFTDAALNREFAIATAYLAGKKKVILGFIRIKGYAEGIRIMEKIAERVGLDTQMGIDASVDVAENYEQRKKFNEAFLKWWEISLEWETGSVGRDALLGMARNKHAVYNKPPEHKRPFYDASCLNSAKSYYGRFKLLYPKDAREIGVDEILGGIDEQLAYKQLSIGRYYQKTGNIQSANLYYDMVVNDWPASKAAQQAKELLTKK